MELSKPKQLAYIFDSSNTPNNTLDNMTFVLKGDLIYPDRLRECLGTSYNGVAFSQFSTCKVGSHLGNLVAWDKICVPLQKHVIRRLNE